MADETHMSTNKPLKSAMTFGLGGGASVALGSWAWFHQKNIRSNTVTVIIGGMAAGLVTGTLSYFIPSANSHTSPSCRHIFNILNFALYLTGYLVAPLIGRLFFENNTKWSEIIIQELAGNATILAGILGLTTVAGTIFCDLKISRCPLTLFTSSRADKELTEILNPVADIA